MSIEIDAKMLKTGFWHFPKPFYAVLFIEFWERFAFYGLQSVAVIYFIQKFGIKESDASDLFGSFTALLFAMLTIGGIVGDKILGLRRTYLLGILFLIAGYAIISFAQHELLLYLGMGVVLVGNIFFKTNATNYVGRCFESNDPRLDSAFTYFYMSINVGAFLGIIITPTVVHKYNSQMGLGLLSMAMIISFVSYLLLRSKFASADNYVGKNSHNIYRKWFVVVSIGLIAAAVFCFLLHSLVLCKIALYTIAVISIMVYLIIASKMNHKEATGMYLALILMFIAITFFVLYIQASTSMTLFAFHHVRLNILGYTIPAETIQSLEAVFIFIFSPILANLYIKLHQSKISYTIPAKFVSGIFLGGLCFITLSISGQFFADSTAHVSIMWVVLAFMFFSSGELLVSALGASMVAQLLPKRLGGFGQGMWYLATAIGIKIGGELSGFAAVNNVADFTPGARLNSYVELYYKLGGAFLIIAFVLFFTIKPLSEMMQRVLDSKY